jgi:hypothetical protein
MRSDSGFRKPGMRHAGSWAATYCQIRRGTSGYHRARPQLICYSSMTGIDTVAQVVFVRKRAVEVQYLTAFITEEQRNEFQTLWKTRLAASRQGCSCRTAESVPPKRLHYLPICRALPGPAKTSLQSPPSADEAIGNNAPIGFVPQKTHDYSSSRLTK